MIILKLKDENEVSIEKSKKNKRKRAKEDVLNYSRSGVVINNKPHFVISVSKKTLNDDEFLKMLHNYKGDILVGENLENEPVLKDVLFDTKPYIKKAIFENFYSFIKTGDYKTKSLLINDKNFLFSNKIKSFLPFVKSLTVITENSTEKDEILNDCFSEYGIKPTFTDGKDISFSYYDIYADFEKIKENKLNVTVLNEQKSIYPSFKYLEVPEELEILKNFELSNSVICAAFKKN